MWYQISNYRAGATAEVLIYGEVGDEFGGGVDATQFYDEVSRLDAPGGITFRINSYGGDVFTGWSVYNQIRKLSVPTTTAVDGIAASIASVIAMAGDRVTMSDNAMIMIHNAWTSLSLAGDARAMAAGSADLDKMASTLRNIDSQIVATYATRVDASEEDIRGWMASETWFTSADSLRLGFVDEITESLALAACLVPEGKYKNTPKRLVRTEANVETIRNLNELAVLKGVEPETPGVSAAVAYSGETGLLHEAWSPETATKSREKQEAFRANWLAKRDPTSPRLCRARARLQLVRIPPPLPGD